ncbi:hypothetical protein CFAM422_000398 [Trichoderma lentiforme]|uniref:DUF7580 domain-containing protein n=1 Tax=Trichoderma lentiforme TaxID=1567552 RepID=A0A9P5CIJ4_9HYPO|nr:hypothetical protein CFAM422_000398 [Trichoderma lentiforme]
MSGFQIAGIVLGAFPIAISALEAYHDIAERVGLFLTIKNEYTNWKNDLNFYKLSFTINMRQLLLPLVADDDTITELLMAPGGDRWQDRSIAELLEKRLGGSYELYRQYIQNMKRVLDEINRELLIDSEWAQKLLSNPQLTSSKRIKIKAFFSKEGLAHQVYKFKLCNNEAMRKRLFGKLQEYNDKLERLLKASDEDLRISTHIRSNKQSQTNGVALCGFWKKAKSAYQALASAWTCQCPQHDAKLLLQHRVAGKAEFDITLNGLIAADWLVRKIRVSEVDSTETARLDESITPPETVAIHESSHKQSYTNGSALQVSGIAEASVKPQSSGSPSVTLTCVTTSSSRSVAREILNICTSFEPPGRLCCGYLTYQNCRYFVYNIHQHSANVMPSVTLDQILQGEIHPLFTRSQRYTLSLVIASTYLQLLESPWLPPTPKRADFLFPQGDSDATVVEIDQPYISQNFKLVDKQDKLSAPKNSFYFAEALDHLGILLLELCFGQILEDQLWRKRLPAGNNNIEKAGYDVLAAREWQCHVNQEAGGDYADAISWCLGGNRSVAPEKWRQEMLHRVIRPLERSRDYLITGGVGF